MQQNKQTEQRVKKTKQKTKKTKKTKKKNTNAYSSSETWYQSGRTYKDQLVFITMSTRPLYSSPEWCTSAVQHIRNSYWYVPCGGKKMQTCISIGSDVMGILGCHAPPCSMIFATTPTGATNERYLRHEVETLALSVSTIRAGRGGGEGRSELLTAHEMHFASEASIAPGLCLGSKSYDHRELRAFSAMANSLPSPSGCSHHSDYRAPRDSVRR